MSLWNWTATSSFLDTSCAEVCARLFIEFVPGELAGLAVPGPVEAAGLLFSCAEEDDVERVGLEGACVAGELHLGHCCLLVRWEVGGWSGSVGAMSFGCGCVDAFRREVAWYLYTPIAAGLCAC